MTLEVTMCLMHLELEMAVDPGYLVASTVTQMDREAGLYAGLIPIIDEASTRVFCFDGSDQTLIMRSYPAMPVNEASQ